MTVVCEQRDDQGLAGWCVAEEECGRDEEEGGVDCNRGQSTFIRYVPVNP